jgi:hypothetical protein
MKEAFIYNECILSLAFWHCFDYEHVIVWLEFGNWLTKRGVSYVIFCPRTGPWTKKLDTKSVLKKDKFYTFNVMLYEKFRKVV